jgi:heavy metal sensor kinase
LKLRINIPETKDEIKKLADTFNEMLYRLEQAFSSQKQFIQDVSHELRTPLTILKGELEVTLNKIRSPQEYESVLLSSLEEIDRISRVVENLLLLAKFDAKQIQLKLAPAELNCTVEEALNDIKTLARQKNIRMDFRADEKIVLMMDQNQMRRLLLNLLDNAVKYTPENGRVNATLSKKNNHALIRISDTGVGIRQDELPRIFDRFYRADKSRNTCGFGLGLSIVKSIVQTHRGTIHAESKLGEGTTFTVSLPLFASPQFCAPDS